MSGIAPGIGLIVTGLALLGLAWVGSQRKLKRNHLAGIRTPSTLSSDQAWFAAHESAAGSLGLSGGLIALIGVGVLTAGFDTLGKVATGVAGAIFVVGFSYSTVVAVRAARAVRDGSD